jgi:molecular chaperone DnaK
MKAEAKAHEAEDKAAREQVEKINQADSLIFQTEKQLKEFGDKIPADKKAPIEVALEKLKEAHKLQDGAAIDTALAEMNTAWTAASEEIYKAQAEQGGAQPQGEAQHDAGQQQANANDHVEDAQFEEVK